MYRKSIILRVSTQIQSITYQQQNFNSPMHFETLTNSLLCKVHIYVDLWYCDIVSEILTN